ncbi:hypothetical protein [Chitinophaga sp. YIM B06452]|uniref:hypothetical protein n=1 Tax=Chitinophaga sp. YIM B06452 TaxID=3082158 RepID=UPI0031FEE3FB
MMPAFIKPSLSPLFEKISLDYKQKYPRLNLTKSVMIYYQSGPIENIQYYFATDFPNDEELKAVVHAAITEVAEGKRISVVSTSK